MTDHAQEYFRRRNSEEDWGYGCGCGCLLVLAVVICSVCFLSRDRPKQEIGEEKAKKDGAAQKSGRVSLSHKVPIRKDVVAWVELDGKRIADWPSGSKEVKFDAPAGKYELTVYSTFRGETRCIFKDSIRINPEDTLEIEVVIGQ